MRQLLRHTKTSAITAFVADVMEFTNATGTKSQEIKHVEAGRIRSAAAHNNLYFL